MARRFEQRIKSFDEVFRRKLSRSYRISDTHKKHTDTPLLNAFQKLQLCWIFTLKRGDLASKKLFDIVIPPYTLGSKTPINWGEEFFQESC